MCTERLGRIPRFTDLDVPPESAELPEPGQEPPGPGNLWEPGIPGGAGCSTGMLVGFIKTPSMSPKGHKPSAHTQSSRCPNPLPQHFYCKQSPVQPLTDGGLHHKPAPDPTHACSTAIKVMKNPIKATGTEIFYFNSLSLCRSSLSSRLLHLERPCNTS